MATALRIWPMAVTRVQLATTPPARTEASSFAKDAAARRDELTLTRVLAISVALALGLELPRRPTCVVRVRFRSDDVHL